MHWADDSERQRTFKAPAFVADDCLQNLPGADLVFVCKNKGYFGKAAVPFNKLGTEATTYKVQLQITSNDASNRRIVDATRLVLVPEAGRSGVSIQEPRGRAAVPLDELAKATTFKVQHQIVFNDTTYQRMVDTTHLVWHPEAGRSDLWPMFLNHRPGALLTYNAFADANVPVEEAKAALDRVSCLLAAPLNSPQLAVLDGAKAPPGSVQRTSQTRCGLNSST